MTDTSSSAGQDVDRDAQSGELGPKPEPATEAPELFPGGVDAVDEPDRYHRITDPAVRDLDPADNPAVDDELPEEIAEPDDKQQEPDQDSGTAEDGETEPPA